MNGRIQILFSETHELITICLSNVPMHAIRVCLLGDRLHRIMDKYRSRSYWEANGSKGKYHWVRWSALCMPKSLGWGRGDLGIVDTKQMNMCLMVKWFWKLHVHEEGLWVDIIRNKYLRSPMIFRLIIIDQKLTFLKQHLFSLGARHQVSNGNSTRLWEG
jgi:hypothetical protein